MLSKDWTSIPRDIERMLECLETIVGGQIMDLERFGPANEGETISALVDNAEMDDYTYRVAGCVGVFWTKMTWRICSKCQEKRKKNFS